MVICMILCNTILLIYTVVYKIKWKLNWFHIVMKYFLPPLWLFWCHLHLNSLECRTRWCLFSSLPTSVYALLALWVRQASDRTQHIASDTPYWPPSTPPLLSHSLVPLLPFHFYDWSFITPYAFILIQFSLFCLLLCISSLASQLLPSLVYLSDIE